MTREIKFRVWDGVNMVYFPEWIAIVDGGKYWQAKQNINYPTDEYPIMQYTGLKDKNGQEIYEGDVLKYTNPNKKLQNHHLRKVVWIQDKAGFRGIKIARFTGDKKGNQRTMINPKNHEVIGNIYETSTLINQ